MNTGLGVSVRTIRKYKRMTLDDLAAKCGTGKGRLSRIENGDDNVTVATLRALAAALDTDPGLLLSISQPQQNKDYHAPSPHNTESK